MHYRACVKVVTANAQDQKEDVTPSVKEASLVIWLSISENYAGPCYAA